MRLDQHIDQKKELDLVLESWEQSTADLKFVKRQTRGRGKIKELRGIIFFLRCTLEAFRLMTLEVDRGESPDQGKLEEIPPSGLDILET